MRRKHQISAASSFSVHAKCVDIEGENFIMPEEALKE